MQSELKSKNISQIKEVAEEEVEEISLEMLLKNNMPLEDYRQALVYFDTENTSLISRNFLLENKNTELEKKIRLLEEENRTHNKPSTRLQTELLVDQNKTLKYRNTELEKKVLYILNQQKEQLEQKQKEIDRLNMTVQYALVSESKQNDKYINLSNESKCLIAEKNREIARLRKIEREAIKDKHLISQLKTENDSFSDVRLMSELREKERREERRMTDKTNPPDLEIPIGPGNYNNVDECTIC